jgi:uncharacterized protein (DUF736 family)
MKWNYPMSKIGTLKHWGPGDFWSDVRGEIKSLQFKAQVRIAEMRDAPTNDKSPTHIVTALDPNGDFMEIGSAWSKTINHGPNTGETFLSVTLDDPSFAHPLNFAVFRDGEEAVATWRRRQEQST